MRLIGEGIAVLKPDGPLRRSGPVRFSEDKPDTPPPEKKTVSRSRRKWGLALLLVGTLGLVGGWAAHRMGRAQQADVEQALPVAPEPHLPHQPLVMKGTLLRSSQGLVERMTLEEAGTGRRFVLERGALSREVEFKLIAIQPWLESGVPVTAKGRISERPETKVWGPVLELADLDIDWQSLRGKVHLVKNDHELVVQDRGSGRHVILDFSQFQADARQKIFDANRPGTQIGVLGVYQTAAREGAQRRFLVSGQLSPEVPPSDSGKAGTQTPSGKDRTVEPKNGNTPPTPTNNK